MTERSVSIQVGLSGADQAAAQLAKIIQHRNDLLGKSKIQLNFDEGNLEHTKKVMADVRAESDDLLKDMRSLGDSIIGKTVPAFGVYQKMLGSIAQAGKEIGPAILQSIGKQRDLAQFWGTSGYVHQAVQSLGNSIGSFVSSGGKGFSSWLQGASANLAQYRMALTGVAAAMLAVGAATALSSKHTQNYIQSTLDSGLMARKLSDKEGAAKWIEGAQGMDYSGGRESRMGIFQTILSKNRYMSQQGAQKATEDIEKFFFANQEMLKKKGIGSAEDLASRASAPIMSADEANTFDDIFGLGFSNKTAQARLGKISTEAKGIDINKAIAMRPDEVLSKRLTATTQTMGDTLIPILNTVLGFFLKLSDAVGKIPGLGKAMGWGAVLAGAASAGLIFVSMIGSLIPGLMTVIGLFSKVGVVTKIAAAGQWLLNAAMTANPIGIAIVAIAGLVAALYLLEKKFGIVTKAWQAFSGSSIGKGILSHIETAKKALSDLLSGKGAGGAIKIGMDLLANSSPLFKLISIAIDYLKRLWLSGTSLTKLFQTGLGFWQKILDFFSWLLSSIKSGLQWVKDGLGITRSEAKANMDKVAAKEGLHWNEQKNAWISSSGAEKSPSAALAKAQEEYNKSPKGFFEGIPGISDLTKAIDDLNTSLKEKAKAAIINPVQAATATVNPVGTAAENTAAQQNSAAGIDYDVAAGMYFRKDTGQVLSGDRSEALRMVGYTPQMEAGGSIIGRGFLIGDPGEEVSPADAVVGAKSSLERINDIISGASPSGGQGITLTGDINIDVRIDKVDNDMDIKKLAHKIGAEASSELLFSIRNQLNSAGLRDIGYLRG